MLVLLLTSDCALTHKMADNMAAKMAAMFLYTLLVASAAWGYSKDDSYHYTDHDPLAGRSQHPVFRSAPVNYTYGPGDRAVLKCRIDNLGTKTVTWRRAGDQHPLTIGLFTFVSDNRITVDFNQRDNEWSLIIDGVRPEDHGGYHCTVVTKDTADNTFQVNLNVKKYPEYSGPAVVVSGKEIIERSLPIHLTCNATGRPDPPHSVHWYKDDQRIDSSAQSGIVITSRIEPRVLISTLVVRHSQVSDTGRYICMSSSSSSDAAGIHVQIVDVTNTNVKRNSNGQEQIGAQLSRGGARPSLSISPLLLLLTTLVTFSMLTGFLKT